MVSLTEVRYAQVFLSLISRGILAFNSLFVIHKNRLGIPSIMLRATGRADLLLCF